jgi:hypothetical protein
MRTLLIVAATLATMTGASAQSLSCVGGYASLHCTMYDSGAFGPAKIIHVDPPLTAADQAEADERIATWERFCDPLIETDASGVRRYTYAHPGCEYGRTR